MSVFQRRLASSTYALLRSFERRIENLERDIADWQSGRLDATPTGRPRTGALEGAPRGFL